jgi:hypothetical protein
VTHVLVISGSMGAGKTTVLGEASDLLVEARIGHAAIDVDAIGVTYLPGAPDDLQLRGLAAICREYASAGIGRFLLACAVETERELNGIRRAIPGAHLQVCRLRASVSVMQDRVRLREPGMHQAQFVARVAELESALDRAATDHFSVGNEGRSVTEVAREMLSAAGWL